MKKLEEFNLKEIKGIIHYESNNFIVCSHGLYSNRDSRKYLELVELAKNEGISCVRFDFRGCGKSKGNFSYNLEERYKDLKNVISYVEKKFKNASFSLFGSSFGGMVSIVYAARNNVTSIAILSTPAKIELEGKKIDIQPYIKNCSNVLIIHGKKDELVESKNAYTIYREAKEPKKLILLNADHSFSQEEERMKALEEVIKWIKRYLH